MFTDAVSLGRKVGYSSKWNPNNGSLDRCRNIEAFDSEPRAWFYQEAETDRSTFAVISLWGKFGGLHTCAATFSYILLLPNIFLTRLFSKLRLKRKDFQEILRLPWARGVPGSNPGARIPPSIRLSSCPRCRIAPERMDACTCRTRATRLAGWKRRPASISPIKPTRPLGENGLDLDILTRTQRGHAQ